MFTRYDSRFGREVTTIFPGEHYISDSLPVAR